MMFDACLYEHVLTTSSATTVLSLYKVVFLQLQNGSDIQGVVAAGVEGEPISLTEPITEAIATSFTAWLLDKKKVDTSRWLRVSIGHDSFFFLMT